MSNPGGSSSHPPSGLELSNPGGSSSHPPSGPEHTPIKQPISSTSAQASKRELFPQTENDSRDVSTEDPSSSEESSQSSFPDHAELPFIQSQEVKNGFENPPELVVQGFALPTVEHNSADDNDEVRAVE